jgi:hypothetical protein
LKLGIEDSNSLLCSPAPLFPQLTRAIDS